jgi:hypothetical protein
MKKEHSVADDIDLLRQAIFCFSAATGRIRSQRLCKVSEQTKE